MTVRSGEENEEVSLPANGRLLSPIFELSKDQDGSFQKEAMLQLDVDEQAWERETGEIRIYRLDEEEGGWIELSHSQLEVDQAIVSVTINRLGIFTVIASYPASGEEQAL